MALPNGNQSWLWPSMFGLVAGIISAYLSIQFAVEQRLSKVEGVDAALALRLSVVDGWIVRTESNRFTLRDGENLKQRIDLHAKIRGHSDVVERISNIEARMRIIEQRRSGSIPLKTPIR